MLQNRGYDSEKLLATAFDRAPIGMSVVDLDLNWLRVNDAYCRMFGYDREELLQLTFRELTHPDELESDIEWLRLAKAGESDGFERDKRYIHRDGTIIWARVRAEMIHGDDGTPAYTVSLLLDITDSRQAGLDKLTGERELRSILNNIPDAVSVQGLDNRFQLINDAFEQQFGVERADVIGRRDDEVLSPQAIESDRTSHAHVLNTGETLELEELVPVGGDDHVFQTVKFPLWDESQNIYAVCAVYKDITDRKRRESELEDRLSWTEMIHASLAQERFVLHGQPIVNLSTGGIEQAELLIRMRDRDDPRTLVPPGDFLPAAERLGLIALIDRWVVARALELAMDHRVEINLSGITISDAEHLAAIESMVNSSRAPRENLIFEITETAVAENIDAARRFAERLRNIGCSFALDDFGVGFGTFTYLKHLPVDYLKIDIEFVRDLTTDETDAQVVSAIVGAAQLFGMKTIAEGVEDQATLELLTEMGVDYAQGYWIGRPVPTEELWNGSPQQIRGAR